jgi:PAS domain S-box-containing protein
MTASEDRYRALMEGANDGILVASTEGEILEINPRMEEVLGLPRDNASGRHVFDFISDTRSLKAFSEVVARGGGHIDNVPIERADGRPLRMDFSISTADVAGRRLVLAIGHDVTERWQAEQRIRLQTRALEASTNAIVITDIAGTIVWVNAAFTTLTGYAYDEAVGGNPRLLKSGTHDPAFYRDLWSTILSGRSWSGEMTNRTKDGRAYVEEMTITPVRSESGALSHFVAIKQDVTERKRAEEMRVERARLAAFSADVSLALTTRETLRDMLQGCCQAMVEHLGAAFARIWTLDAEQSILELQASAGIYTHLDGGHAHVPVGKLKIGLIAQERRPHLTNDVLSDPRLSDREWAQREGMVAFAGYPLIVEGELVGVAGLFAQQPLSEFTLKALSTAADSVALGIKRKKAEKDLKLRDEQLRQAQKMEAVGQLAGGVAHDFNNLLGVITGYSELLLRNLSAQDPRRARLDHILQAAQRAASLTRQLLAFGRRQILEPRVLDLNELVTDFDKLLRRVIGENIQLVKVCDEELGRVKADPGQIEQVIMNLAVNARDAISGAGRLIIETANVELDEAYARNRVGVEPGAYVMLAVSDTGHGMDADTRSHIFEPFFTTKEPGKGTGLGLATVYGIVKQSGGHIHVYSEPGRGSTFKVYLPRVYEGPERRRAELAGTAPTGSETVLLVEDETPLREMIREVLELNGYRVLAAADPAAAIDAVQSHSGPIGLVVTDVVMPQKSGRDLADELRALRPEARVLYMSGYTDQIISEQDVLAPGAFFLAKPFTTEALLRKIRDVLEAPGSSDERVGAP